MVFGKFNLAVAGRGARKFFPIWKGLERIGKFLGWPGLVRQGELEVPLAAEGWVPQEGKNSLYISATCRGWCDQCASSQLAAAAWLAVRWTRP